MKKLILLIMFFIGLAFLPYSFGYSNNFGPLSEICKNLTEIGWFETHMENVGHDSCINGTFEWKEDCRLILPWGTTKCMYDYNPEDLDKNCLRKKRYDFQDESNLFYMNCVTSPFNKMVWLFPFFVNLFFIILPTLFFILSKLEKNKNETK